MSPPVALVTGGGSGIGLAAAEHLIHFHGFRVAIADIVAERVQEQANRLGIDKCLPLHIDVSDYKALSQAFLQTFEWGGNRLDLFFANAGIGETGTLYKDTSLDPETGLPPPVNLRTIDVNLNAVIQGVNLARHFFIEKNPTPGGRIVITSSCVGLYPLHCLPLYAAAKHGLVGLVRSLAPVYAKDNITINSLHPALIATNLMRPDILPKWDKAQLTSLDTVRKAFDGILADDELTGQTMELTLNEVVFTQVQDFARENTKWVLGQWDIWESAFEKLMPRPTLENAVEIPKLDRKSL